MTNSLFSHINAAVPDPILGVAEAFRDDTSPNKVNLGVGVYQDGAGKIPMLNSIKEAASRWISHEDTKTYLPIDGCASFNDATQIELFGKNSTAISEKRVATIQSIGGSGALKLGIDFIRRFFPEATVYLSDPSWENHRVLFEAAGAKVETYPYFDTKTSGIRLDAMLECFRGLEKGSVVLLHACCHNPTGVDIPRETWSTVADICLERGLIPFVDIAYQGFAAGLEEDAYPIRLMSEKGLHFFVASSFSKSFSLYRERVGALSIVTASAKEATLVVGQVKRLIRAIYSSPPSYGAQLVSIVLSDPNLRELWVSEVDEMRLRILEMRKLFVKQLAVSIPNRDFSFIGTQRGMFSYSGLSKEVIQTLKVRHNIHALESGRICVAAMNPKNIEYVCKAIASVLN